MTRLLRKLRELFVGLYSAITMPRWNPYGGQAREACGLPLACVICGKDSAENISRVCEECRILAREGYVQPPKVPQWEHPAVEESRRFAEKQLREFEAALEKGPPINTRKVVKGPWS